MGNSASADSSNWPSNWREQIYDWLEVFKDQRWRSELFIAGLSLSQESELEAEASFNAITFGIDFRRQRDTRGRGLLRWRFRLGRGEMILTVLNNGLVALTSNDLGAPLTFRGDRSELSLDFDLDRMRAVWDSKQEILSEIHVDAKDAVLKSGRHQLFEAEGLTLEALAEPLAGQGWDQSLSLALSQIEWTGSDAMIDIEGVSFAIQSDDNDLAALADWFEHFQLIDEAEDEVALPPMTALWRALTLTLEVEEMRIGKANSLNAYRLGALTAVVYLNQGEGDDALNLSLLFAGRDIGLQRPIQRDDTEAKDLIPTDWHLPLTLEGLSGAALSALLLQLASGPVLEPRDGDDLASVWRAMTAAGTSLRIDGLSIDGALWSLAGDGALRLDAGGPLGLRGEASFLLSGIEETEEAVRAVPDSEATKAIVSLILVLKGLGTPVDDEGAIAYRYDLAFPQTGGALLNNLPLAPLLAQFD